MAVQSTLSIHGRDAELTLLEEALAGLVAGHGRALLIEGEPGIGKSALVSTGLSSAEPAGCRVLRGACEELTRRFPLRAFVQALGTGRLSAGHQPAPGEHQQVPAEDPVAAAVDQLGGLVDRLCASGPLVLVVEDLHWADEASLLLWEHLSRVTTRLPLLLVGTCRPVPVRPELDRLRRTVRASGGVVVTLDGLAEPETAKLATERLGGAPGPRLTRLLASAAGNPRYTAELLAALARSEAVRTVTGGVELTADMPSRAVTPWARMIVDQLDFLSPRTRATLRAAAVLGPHFSVTDLATVVDASPNALAGAVDEALAARVVEADGARLRFRHGLIRRSLYETTPTALRAALHQHAAKALIAAGAPVEHVAALVLPVLAEAEGWEAGWIAANAPALADRSPHSAAHLLEYALARLDSDDPRRADVEDQVLAVAYRLGRDQQAERTAKDIVARGTERAGRAAWYLGSTLLRAGRSEEAAAVLADIETAPPLWRARNSALRSTALVGRGDRQESQQAAGRAHDEGRQLAEPLATAQALYTRSALGALTHDFADALTSTDGILALADGSAELAELRLTVLGDRTAVLAELDRFTEAEAAARGALASAERTQWPVAALALRTRIAELNYTLGRWDRALEELADLEAARAEPEAVRLPGAAHAVRALIAGQRDDWQEASRHLAALGERPTGDERLVGSAVVLRARALGAEHAARPERVVELLAPCLTPGAAARMIDPISCLPTLVRAARECGDLAALRTATRGCRAAAEGEQYPARQADLDWCGGMLAGDPSPMLAAASYYRTRGRRPALGNVLEDAAVVQAACGDVTAARGTLEEALEVYAELGAAWNARRAAARLRPYGVHLGVRGARQRPLNGRQALTDTERRVAELVGQGLTNPEIARRLLLSRRTVETHVSRILAKLQIRSRREVARHVRPKDA
jgi:DNA-binding CsgD family transcriptional regulator